MNRCKECEMLISVYIDGELSASEKMLVEEHLKSCRDCSALFSLYREMSTSIAQSCAQAPPSLNSNVMKMIKSSDETGDGSLSYLSFDKTENRPLSRDAEHDSENPRLSRNRSLVLTKKQRTKRLILTRYVPIAACLAIAILVLPQFFNFNRNDATPDAIMPTMAPIPEYAVESDDGFLRIDAYGFSEEHELWGTPEVMMDEDVMHELMPATPFEGRVHDDIEPGVGVGGPGWRDVEDSLYIPHGIITAGYHAFIVIDLNRPISIPMIAYHGNYFLIEQADLARFLEEYDIFITLFVPGDEDAEFALLLIES